jgi:hypothetical protein
VFYFSWKRTIEITSLRYVVNRFFNQIGLAAWPRVETDHAAYSGVLDCFPAPAFKKSRVPAARGGAGGSPKSEGRRPKEGRNPKPETKGGGVEAGRFLLERSGAEAQRIGDQPDAGLRERRFTRRPEDRTQEDESS